jgi:hypothetical protein
MGGNDHTVSRGDRGTAKGKFKSIGSAGDTEAVTWLKSTSQPGREVRLKRPDPGPQDRLPRRNDLPDSLLNQGLIADGVLLREVGSIEKTHTVYRPKVVIRAKD